MVRRVANTIAAADAAYGGDTEKTAQAFYDMMDGLKFMPNSPTLMNAGRELGSGFAGSAALAARKGRCTAPVAWRSSAPPTIPMTRIV